MGRSARRSGWVIALQRLAQPDRAVAAVGVLVEAPVEVERLLAAQHAPDDLDVLAGAGQRHRRRAPVPALHDLGPRHAQPETEAAFGEVVEGDRGHRRGGRGAGGQLHDRGAEPDAAGVAGEPAERGEGVGAPRLGRPHRVEAEALGLLGDRRSCRAGAPAPQYPHINPSFTAANVPRI